MDLLRGFLLNPATVWVLIPVAAIVVTGIRAITKANHRHRERMAMIERGMDPDRGGVRSDDE